MERMKRKGFGKNRENKQWKGEKKQKMIRIERINYGKNGNNGVW